MVFTVFVNNLPDKANSNWLATVFQSFGKVLDVFISEKRSRWGRRFGFIKFETIWEAKRAIWNLNGVFFLENKIGVNMARFTPRNMFWKKVVGNRKSFVSKLTAGKDEGMRTQRADQIGNDKHKSYLQVLMNTENTTTKVVNQRVAVDEFKDKGVCTGKIDNGNLLWLQRSLIGYYKGSADEETMKIEVEKEAGKEVTIRRYSGNNFLITFDQVDSMEATRLEGWKNISNWFENIRIWSEESVVNYRIIWLVCYGVPLLTWNLETYQNIGGIWGEFLQMHKSTLKMESFARGCMQIQTKNFSKIDEVIMVKIGSKIYSIKVRELDLDCVFSGQSCYDIFNKALVGTQPYEGSSIQFGNGYNMSCEDKEEGPVRQTVSRDHLANQCDSHLLSNIQVGKSTKGRSQNFVAFSSSVEGPGFNLKLPGHGPDSRKQGPKEVSRPSEPLGFEIKPQKPFKQKDNNKKKELVDLVGPSFSFLSKPPSKAPKVARVNTSKPGRRRKVFISGSSFSSSFLINRARHPSKCKNRNVDDLEDSLNQTCVSETSSPSFKEHRPSDEAQTFLTCFERAKEDIAFDPRYKSEAQATWLLGKELGLGARDNASIVRKLTISLMKDKES